MDKARADREGSLHFMQPLHVNPFMPLSWKRCQCVVEALAAVCACICICMCDVAQHGSGLQDSRARLLVDKERARREGFKFGAKLVRGAYMFMENERAKQKGFPSPVWPSKQDTHDNYDRCGFGTPIRASDQEALYPMLMVYLDLSGANGQPSSSQQPKLVAGPSRC